MTAQISYLQPGEIIVTSEPKLITTIVGSCITVCLYNADFTLAGMNHFLYPFFPKNGTNKNTYGDESTTSLINQIRKQANSKPIYAKLFGGASMSNSSHELFKTGQKNSKIAKEVLELYNIQIVNEDTGGILGRKIEFNTSNGIVKVSYLNVKANE